MPLRTTIAASAIVPTPKETQRRRQAAGRLAEPGVDRRLQRDQAAGAGREQDRDAPIHGGSPGCGVIFASRACFIDASSSTASNCTCCHISNPGGSTETMNPPPAEGFASRLFLGPALRTQPDRRLVTLVRDGYETAFEEIVRRYGKALTRYAAAIVGGRSEDVTQDAFSKALLALRRDSRRRDRPAAVALPDRPQHGAQRPARPAARPGRAGRGARRRLAARRPRRPSAARRSRS